jgi:hypothetical protein
VAAQLPFAQWLDLRKMHACPETEIGQQGKPSTGRATEHALDFSLRLLIVAE